jgi:ATP-dependent helicase/nuclease subunit A
MVKGERMARKKPARKHAKKAVKKGATRRAKKPGKTPPKKTAKMPVKMPVKKPVNRLVDRLVKPTPAAKPSALPDAAEREAILGDLDRSMVVEAAAGTGKTTSMVGRMVALVAEGLCEVERIAAVTFTRKAAAELRSRFQVALEREVRESEGERRHGLEQGLARSARAFIGTIHSFCARLLRERPVEAGVGFDFREIDDVEDARCRRDAWELYMSRAIAEDDPVAAELASLGVQLADLHEAFGDFADFPDVAEWPAPEVALPDPAPAREALEELADHVRELLPSLPDDPGNDKLIPAMRDLVRMLRRADLSEAEGLFEVFESMRKASVVQKMWPGKKAQAVAERDGWERFREEVARQFIEQVHARRYALAVRALERARGIYDRLRSDLQVLNFQDLLLAAARMLREHAHVRRYFRARFTHLLVDEFQDTDPIQAEVMLLLTADDSCEREWRECSPVPGSLFVVGDPKQSIYRFRRADIVTYNAVKGVIRRTGGTVLSLSANFRTSAPVVDWVNGVFAGAFPERPTDYSPDYVALRAAREDSRDGDFSGVRRVEAPPECSNQAAIARWDADRIARTIRAALDDGATVTRSSRDADRGVPPEARPGDFMVVTYRKGRLTEYARALERLGVPHEVTGGGALGEVEELGRLLRCLRALVRPDDPVALVAALRSDVFGVSDRALYAFRRAGAEFAIGARVPEDVEPEDARALGRALEMLGRYARTLASMPPVPAIERIAADLGLIASAAVAAEGGPARAGGMGKAFELLRAAEAEEWSAAEAVDCLERIVSSEEKHDGLDARPAGGALVRVMNLHKVKGLEAPVVFLADPSGRSDRPPSIHIDRSGGEARGYMKITVPSGQWSRRTVGAPGEWDALASAEKRFLDAEETRLLYVAATRAGSALVVSGRAKPSARDPWNFFTKSLAGAEGIDDPGARSAPVRSAVKLAARDVEDALKRPAARWAASLADTYSVLRAGGDARAVARELGLPDEAPAEAGGQLRLFADDTAPGVPAPPGEQGTEWGSAIHTLLQAAMAAPESDLEPLAVSTLLERGLDQSLSHDAVETVKAVMKSDIWRRALAAELTLVETPFTFPLDGASGEKLVNGRIDLAFREDGEWVIVDYKTDAVGKSRLAAVAARHGPQVRAYAEVWRRVTGAPVRETGLFFVRAGAYVPC